MSVASVLARFANNAQTRPCVFVLTHDDYTEVYEEDGGAPYIAGVVCVPGDRALLDSYAITSNFGELTSERVVA